MMDSETWATIWQFLFYLVILGLGYFTIKKKKLAEGPEDANDTN